MTKTLTEEEYKALSGQKADDWRSVSNVNPTLFAAAGAIFAAGVAQRQPEVVALSPLPLFLSVWHMIRHARLQLQMITYLAVFGPDGGSWERDVAAVRPLFWEQAYAGNPAWLARLKRPSAWNTWLIITWVFVCVAVAVPVLAGYSDAGWAALVGTLAGGVGTTLLIWQAGTIERDRAHWTRLWEGYREA